MAAARVSSVANSSQRCSGYGNFNPIYGRCICAPGYSGEHCETLALLACRSRARSNTIPSCIVQRPQHCECRRQCEARGAFKEHMYAFCFERVSEEVALSELPAAGNNPNVKWYEGWSPATTRKKLVPASLALAVQHRSFLRHISQRYCTQRCSERGACVLEERFFRRAGKAAGGADEHDVSAAIRRGGRPVCECDIDYSGPSCERHASPLCYSDCSGRGTCSDGFCLCRPPFFGPACAYGASSEAASASSPSVPPPRSAASRALHFKMHVYDLDPIWLRRYYSASDRDPIFNTFHTFTASLLADPRTLTAAPDDADLLLVPAFGTNMHGLLEYYEHAQKHVARTFPQLWSRRNGADHLWITSGDGGGCDLNRMAALQASVIAAHFLMLNASVGKWCGVAGKDVAFPPDVPAVSTSTTLWQRGHRLPRTRLLDFFFAGNVPDKHQVDTTSDEALSKEGYSEGVRQLVWKYHRRRPGYRVVERSPTYLFDWGDSKFCLTPLGVGWGVRLAWAVGGGCVPVLASSHVSQWFDDALQYDTFALRGIEKLSIPSRLPMLLSSITPAVLAEMHAALLRHRRVFHWRGEGMAYNVTLHELCWRARYRRAGVDCASLLPPAAARLVIPPARRAPVPVPQGVRGLHVPASRVAGLGGESAAWLWWRRERST